MTEETRIGPHSRLRDILSILAITFIIMGGLSIMAAAAVIAVVGSSTANSVQSLGVANHALQESNSQKDATARKTTTAVDGALYAFASNLDENVSVICLGLHLNCAPLALPTTPTTTTTTHPKK